MGRFKRDEDMREPFYQKMPKLEKEEIDRYAAAYNMEKQNVAALVRRWGWKEFRKKYPLDIVEKAEEMNVEGLSELEKKRLRREKQVERIRKARLRQIMFEGLHDEDNLMKMSPIELKKMLNGKGKKEGWRKVE